MNRTEWLYEVKQQLPSVETAVEIGVWRGDYSQQIINVLKPKTFYGVDPYELFEGMVSAPGPEYNTQEDLDALASAVENRLQHLNQSVLLRMTSVDAVAHFEDESIDFVYIDGDHTYRAVVQDLAIWWPKLKKGGIMSGDDYIKSITGKGYPFGVIPAVNEFVQDNNLELSVTKGANPSWWFTK